MKPDFLFLYEHVVREFEADCLIIAELEKRGYHCELMQLMEPKHLRFFTFCKPKVIVTSAMYDNETLNSFVYNNVGRLQKVVNLHWEEVLSPEQEQSDFYNLKQNAAKCTHICWGEAARNRVIAGGVPANNAVITGAVQLDFLLPRFSGYYLTREQLADRYSLDPSKRWLLYISSFSCAHMDDKEIAELDAMTNLDFGGFKAVGARSMNRTLEWFDRYLGEHPEQLLIYRPHPSEWQSPPLHEMERKHPNFRVISDLSVKQWVKVCDLPITWMSTSIAEVYFAGKSCAVVRPEPLHDDYDPIVYRNVRAADSYDSMCAAIASDNPPFPIDEALLCSHYDRQPDKAAYERVADLLEWTLLNPPRDLPFSDGYRPRFNLVKFFALIGLNAMVSLGVDPHRFDFLGRRLTDQTERLMGYIKKARLPRGAARDKIDQLREYVS